MDTGIDLLQSANQELVIPVPGSYEELVTQIRATPHGLLTYREFGHFLKTTQRGYGEPMRTVLMDLYDWPPNRQYVRNLRKSKTVIDPPISLSMLSSIATDLLFSWCDAEEWTGGFFGRMLLLYGERTEFRMPQTWPAARDYLTNVIHRLYQYPFPQCGGFSPDAFNLFHQWSQHQDNITNRAPTRVQTHIAGAATLAAKVALLYAADAGECGTGNGWLVSYESMTRAIMFVETLYLPSLYHLGERLTLGIWERDRQRVLDIVASREHGVMRPELLRMVKLESQYLETVLATLKDENTIERHTSNRGELWRKVGKPNGGEPTPVVPIRPDVIQFQDAGLA